MATAQVQWIRKSKPAKATKRQQQSARRVEQTAADRDMYYAAYWSQVEG